MKMKCKKEFLSEMQVEKEDYSLTLNLLDLNLDKMTIRVAISDLGKITVEDFDLYVDKNENLYFELGVRFEKILVDDFENLILGD